MPIPTSFHNLGVVDPTRTRTDVVRLDDSPGGVLLQGRGWALEGWTIKTIDADGVISWAGERSVRVRGVGGPIVDQLESIAHVFDPTNGQLLTLVADPDSAFLQIEVQDLGTIVGASKQIRMAGENAHCLLDNTLREQLHLRWDADADEWLEQSRSQRVKRRAWIPESGLRTIGTPITGVAVGTTPTVTAITLNSTDDGVIAAFTRPPDYADATSVTVGLAVALSTTQTFLDLLAMIADYVTAKVVNRDINHASTQVSATPIVVGTVAVDTLYEVAIPVPVSDANNPLTTWDLLVLEARLDPASVVTQVNVLGMFLEYSPRS